MSDTVPVEYFVDLYKHHIDPWHFETSPYERAKYAATMRALPRSHYESALEVACSIGVFTNQLARRCNRVLAVDVSEEALTRARRNCTQPQVRFERRAMPYDYPAGTFDLTTVCEVGFYLAMDDLLALRSAVIAHSRKNAHIVLVHWTPPVNGHATTAQEVHDVFHAASELRSLHGFSAPTYRLDVLERC